MGCYHFFDAGQMEHMRRDVSRTGTVTSASSKQHASKPLKESLSLPSPFLSLPPCLTPNLSFEILYRITFSPSVLITIFRTDALPPTL